MSIINVLIRLLSKAYKKEAELRDREAEKLMLKSQDAGNRAVELAKEAQEEQDFSQELRAEATTEFNKADRLRKRGEEVTKFFSGEEW